MNIVGTTIGIVEYDQNRELAGYESGNVFRLFIGAQN